LGRRDFDEVRILQEERISKLEELGEVCIFCEHSPVITAGVRTSEEELRQAREVSDQLEIPLVEVSRGGALSIHLPGMLMLYPVCNLRARKTGIKKFVESVFNIFSESVSESFGRDQLEFFTDFTKPGLWSAQSGKKIASVGLKIERGVSNLGFAFNLSNSLETLEALNPCGISASNYSRIDLELGFESLSQNQLYIKLVSTMSPKLSLF
jgi:lipoate-protein ligase B